LTPLSWCLVISTAANVATAAMVGWFLLVQPNVHVTGFASVDGTVRVAGGTLDVQPADKDAILKVQLCEQTSELSEFTLPPNNKREMVPVTRCASIDQAAVLGGFKSYGLSVVPASR
jgi:hypothetical protein